MSLNPQHSSASIVSINMSEIETISKKVSDKSGKKKKKKTDGQGLDDRSPTAQLPPLKPPTKKKTKGSKKKNEPQLQERDEKQAMEGHEKNPSPAKEKTPKKTKRSKKSNLDTESQFIEEKLAERTKKRKAKAMAEATPEPEEINSDDDIDEDLIAERIMDPELAKALKALREDVNSVDDAISLAAVSRAASPVGRKPHALSTHVDKVFTEKPHGGFSNVQAKKRKVKTTKLSSINPDRAFQDESIGSRITPTELAISMQKVFRSFGVFSHGFLAGIAFWHVVTISVLSQGLEMTTLDFIALYSPLAQPVQCIFYFLAVICTISILDRYDLALFDWRQLQMLLTCRSGGMAMLVYLVSLVMNLVTTKLDDKLSLHSVNATIFDSMTTQDLETEFSVWKGLNYCRCLGFILGWFLVALRPSTDLLQKHLRKLVHKRGTPEKNGLSNHGFVG